MYFDIGRTSNLFVSSNTYSTIGNEASTLGMNFEIEDIRHIEVVHIQEYL
jgi:hypothetical protein